MQTNEKKSDKRAIRSLVLELDRFVRRVEVEAELLARGHEAKNVGPYLSDLAARGDLAKFETFDDITGNKLVLYGPPGTPLPTKAELVKPKAEADATVAPVDTAPAQMAPAATTPTSVSGGQPVPASAPPLEPPTWEQPIPLGTSALPKFPIESLPSWLTDYVKAVADEIQVATDLPAMLTLGVIAGGLARKARVLVRHNYEQPANIYTCCIAGVGERKSPTFDEVMAPVREIERELRESARTELQRLTQAHEAAKAKAADKALEDGEREAAESLLASTATALSQYRPLDIRLTITGNVTREKLEVLLASQGGRLMVTAPEGSVFDVVAGRFGGKPCPDVYLEAHSGDQITCDRVSRGTIIIERPAITCAVAVQPEVMREIGAIPALAGRGFLGRWLYCIPEEMAGRRKTSPQPAPEVVRSGYRTLVTKLWRENATLESPEVIISMAEDARAAFENFDATIEPRLGQHGDLRSFSGWSNKLMGAVARLSLLVHVARRLGDGVEPAIGGSISRESVEAAIKIAEYLIPHAMAALEAADDRTLITVQRIVSWMIREHLTTFSYQQAWRRHRGHVKRAEVLKDALQLLAEHSYIREHTVEVAADGKNQRKHYYTVNPALLAKAKP